ncbi:clathrin coat assembly protein ap19 [Rhodotorula toruloides]|uniref:AP complex subunit sigma n=1 Tax=Rhodotorula toruloides TaxID=5286 RepID=A0A511KT94_RHOTO|nr:clathrin coat assembly protein ap19 [Rhodotorula toruloides]
MSSGLQERDNAKVVKDVTQLVLSRRTRMCNFLEYKGAWPSGSVPLPLELTLLDLAHKDSKIVYRRYASLFFVCGIGPQDNELITLEIIHRYVEVLDPILDELIIAGEMQESSKKSVLKAVGQADQIEEQELSEDPLGRLGQR